MKKFVPRKEQEVGIELFVKKAFAGLFWPPGLGKTAVTLFAFQILKKLGFVDHMVVISKPKIVTNTWPREIKKWVPMYSYAIAKGGNKRFMAALETKADITLINMENCVKFVELTCGYRRKIKVGLKKRWKTFPPERPDLLPKKCMLVFDESSKWRNAKASRFDVWTHKLHKRGGKIALNLFPRRYILTGSPAPKSLMNLWSQMFLLDIGEALGSFVSHFRTKYFHPAGFKGYSWEINDGASKHIYKRLVDRILRIGDGTLKMPKKVFVDRMVDVEPEARSVYDEMEREAIVELEGEKITTANAGVRTQKLRQLANGFIYGASDKKKKRKSYTIHNEKAEEALNLVEETQGVPALIGYIYDSDLVALENTFESYIEKGTCRIVSSATSDEEFDEIEEEWNEGRVHVLIGQIDILSHGLNLQDTEASVIYYTIPWDLEAYEQFFRRVWRPGQKFTVMIYHLLTRDSVDDNVVLPCIKKKDKRQKHLLDYLETFMTRRKKFTRAESVTKVGNKEGMEAIFAILEASTQPTPKIKPEVKDPGGVLLSAILKKVKSWSTTEREILCAALTKNDSYDGPTGYPTAKKMIEEVFCADVEKPITPDTWKMWPGYRPKKGKGEKKVTTNKAGFGKGSKKTKKKAAKKKTAKKKVAKKAAKKKVTKKVTKKAASKKAPAEKKITDGKTYVAVADKGKPKLELRAKIVAHIAKAKGRGLKGNKILEWAVKEGISMKRCAGHLKGGVKKGFLKTK